MLYRKSWPLVIVVMVLAGLAMVGSRYRQTAHGAGLVPDQRGLEWQLFTLINDERGAQGLFPYQLDSTLSSGARLHSEQMSMANCGMQHQCPGEPDPCTRLTDEGVAWMSCGENIAYTGANPTNWAGVQAVEEYMLNEQPPDDGHRVNLLSTSYHRVGVGVYIDASGIIWITQDFAS